MKRIRIINHFLILSDFLILLLFLFLLKESMYLKWYLLELFHINIRLKIILNAEWPAKFIRLLLLDKQKNIFWINKKMLGVVWLHFICNRNYFQRCVSHFYFARPRKTSWCLVWVVFFSQQLFFSSTSSIFILFDALF